MGVDMIDFMLKIPGVDVNKQDLVGNTPLYMAAFKGNLQMVEFLMSKGSDPCLLSAQNSSVLHICAERNFHQIAKVIMESNLEKYQDLVFEQTLVDPDTQDGGETALHVACEWSSMEMVELLWQWGDQKLVNIKNGDGQDAIDFAYAENQDDASDFLCTKMGRAHSR